MGNGQLVSLCENMAKIMQKRKMVFIADRDHNDTNKKLGGKDGKQFKKWGNNVTLLYFLFRTLELQHREFA